jgi:hypothetical protein
VSPSDEAVVRVLDEIATMVLGNTSGPDALLARFRKYEYLYSRAELDRVAALVARGPEFNIRELREEMEKFDKLIGNVRGVHVLLFLACFIVHCTGIGQ